ncbi:MAG: HEPN domain-containing protein [Pelagibacterales bacterium]|nr:HEPN domain-containing protein [Pelagibacterales bacterium]
MEISINHLPDAKKSELERIVAVIKKNCDNIEKIILFGSYARGNYKEAKDINPNSRTGHVSDYDILVVTGKKDVALNSLLWGRISEELQSLNLSAFPKILTHDIEELNKKLSEGQYFFSDIKKEGIMLLDSGKFELADEKNLTNEERSQIAQKHFDYWFDKSQMFLGDYNSNLSNFDATGKEKFLTQAAFHLHQVAESCYKAILLVFTNYTPREHFLEILGKKSEKCSPEFKDIFSKATKEDEDRFNLLEYAYIGGRYDPDFRICKQDLEILAKDVNKLLNLTDKICEQKIKILLNDVINYSLPKHGNN